MTLSAPWFPPLTNREVIMIVACCAAFVILLVSITILPFESRFRAWAKRHGYRFVQAVPMDSGFWSRTWHVTVRDASGAKRVGVAHVDGVLPDPESLEVAWEQQHPPDPSPFNAEIAQGPLRIWMTWFLALGFYKLRVVVDHRRDDHSLLFTLLFMLGPPLLFTGVWLWRRRPAAH
ncbi:MAG TPA: hypothetical protein VG454_09595 [Gemmatimonadales bacterium]|nr:hypothetical protein [Gemmatimonadales bacterium]